MNDFSPDWLKLRESADVRARNRDVADVVSARFALRDQASVVDLGCGTGSNLRATAQLLPARQSWTLVDHDRALLAAAQRELTAWADRAELVDPAETPTAGVGYLPHALELTKGSLAIAVRFRELDLARELESALSEPVDMVTASALFDLVSEDFIRALARSVTKAGATFYTVMTCNGVQRWSPHRPADNQIQSAFQQHQMGDKGFGPAAGPLAASILAEEFRLSGYLITEGESPWRLGRNDRMLINEMVRGHAMAASETGLVDAKTIENWVKVQRTAAETGHLDVCAVPTAAVRF